MKANRTRLVDWKKTVLFLILIIYSISALWIVLIGRLFNRIHQFFKLGSTHNHYVYTPDYNSTFFDYSYWKLNINLIPFKTIKLYFFGAEYVNLSIIINNLFGNIALFLPFGLLPILFKQLHSKSKYLLVSFLTILLIEILQYILQVGMADIDDVILNMSGVIIGFWFYKIVMRKKGKKNTE